MLCAAKKRLHKKHRRRTSYRKLSQSEARDLLEASESTGFSQNEVLEIYNDFNSMLEPKTASFGVSKQHFVEKTKILNNPYSEKLAELIFEAIPKAHPDYLSLKEFLYYLHLLYHGTPEQKLEFSFSIIKEKDSDFVTKEDLRRILTILLNIHSYLSGEQGPTEAYVTQIIDYIMEQFDENKNGRIDWAEFKNTSTQNLDLFGVFQLVGGEALKSKFLKKMHDNDIEEIVGLLNKIKAEYSALCSKVFVQDRDHLLVNMESKMPDAIFQSQLMYARFHQDSER